MIDGSATYETICKELGDTAAPFDSLEQCRRFIRAASLFLAQPVEQTGSTGGTRFDARWVAAQLDDAKQVLSTFTPAIPAANQRSSIVYGSLRNFR